MSIICKITINKIKTIKNNITLVNQFKGYKFDGRTGNDKFVNFSGNYENAGNVGTSTRDRTTAVNFDGKILGKDANIIGKMLSGGLAVDVNNRILGKVYKIGATILGNDGQYKGRLAYDGSVLDAKGNNIGYVKSNGAYVDLDKKVSGYVLGEVAKNRRN